MPARNGRTLTIDWDSVVLAGVKTKSFSITNDYVDVTTDDEDGWRTLLADPGLRSIEVTVGGITKDRTLIAAIMAANITSEILEVNVPQATGCQLNGPFLVSSYEGSGEHDGPMEFSATFMSAGAITYVPGT